MLGSARDAAVFEVVLWLAGVVAVATLAAVVMYRLLTRARRSSRADESCFTLAELRRLHEQGALTADEYEALKERTVATLTADSRADS